MKSSVSVFGATLLFLSACAGESVEQEPVTVDSQPVACIGEGQHLCLRVKHSGEQEWTWHYGGIQGFSYTWGSVYTLAYARNEIENPPADGSSVEWVLLDVISQMEDAVGTEYGFEAVRMQEVTVTDTDGDYAFIGYPFACAENLDCDTLVALSGSNQSVDLSFRYLGDGEVELISWE